MAVKSPDELGPNRPAAVARIDSNPVLLYEPGQVDNGSFVSSGRTIRLEEVTGPPSAIRSLLEALPEAVLLLNGREYVWFANLAARDLLGVAQRQGPTFQFLRAPAVVDALEVIQGNGAQTIRYHERVPFDRWIEVHIARVALNSEGLQTALLVVLRDLTKSERLERMRADFVANVSHELRTPLASLAGFIETLRGPARDDPVARQRFLEIMDFQAKRMSRLISDQLALSRIELDEHIRPDTRTDLRDLAAAVIDSLRPAAENESVELVLDNNGPVPVLGYSDELARLVENLIDNAIKYGGGGKRVEVSVTAEQEGEERFALLSVRDFGRGIAREHLPRLTERFYRVDTSESRAKGGTGLGLALVKHIVARHRGNLSVESAPGKGAVFSVRFDLAK